MRHILLLALLTTTAVSAEELTPYLPPGMKRAELDWALGTDLGSGLAGAMPEALIAALVELYPQQYGRSIRAAYGRYGFLLLKGRRLPAGIVEVRRLGLRAHQYNCLACHASPDRQGRWVVGGTNPKLDITGWYVDSMDRVRELLAREKRPLAIARVAARLAAAARRTLSREGRRLSAAERAMLLLYVSGIAKGGGPPAKKDRPVYGPGRAIVQAAYRPIRFGLPSGPFAPVKPPDLFGVRFRQRLLWGGNEEYRPSAGPAERIARNGMLVPWIQIHPLTRKPIPDLLTLLNAPRYLRMGRLLARAAPPPLPAPRGAELARFRRGRKLFENSCVACHGSYAHDRVGRGLWRTRPVRYRERLIPAAQVGTDPAYTAPFDSDYRRAFGRTLLGRLGLFEPRKTDAYVARPLLGLRLRAPYLHNASVPTLEALLTAPRRRPRRFRVGDGWRRTDRPGNRATGHPYGTTLSPEQKRDLLAYLRRL